MHAVAVALLAGVWAAAPGGEPTAAPVETPPVEAWTWVEEPGFRFEFPAGAKQQDLQVETKVGTLTIRGLAFEAKDRAVVFTSTEFPREFIEQSLPFKVLDGARDGGLANVGGKLEREVHGVLESGIPGRVWPTRRLSALGPKGLRLELFLCLAGARLYQFMEVRPAGQEGTLWIDRVLSSLKFRESRTAAPEGEKQP